MNKESAKQLIIFKDKGTPEHTNKIINGWLSYYSGEIQKIQSSINIDILSSGKIIYFPLSPNSPTDLIYRDNPTTTTNQHHKGADESGLHCLTFSLTKNTKFGSHITPPLSPFVAFDEVTGEYIPVLSGEIMKLNTLINQGIGKTPAVAVIGYTFFEQQGRPIEGVITWLHPSFTLSSKDEI